MSSRGVSGRMSDIACKYPPYVSEELLALCQCNGIAIGGCERRRNVRPCLRCYISRLRLTQSFAMLLPKCVSHCSSGQCPAVSVLTQRLWSLAQFSATPSQSTSSRTIDPRHYGRHGCICTTISHTFALQQQSIGMSVLGCDRILRFVQCTLAIHDGGMSLGVSIL